MGREKLAEAADILQEAASRTADDDLEERILNQADQLQSLSERTRGPDHGRLDRHMHVLNDIAAGTDGELQSEIHDALDRIRAYRETVEGV